ncbi:hypothetical protein DDB_G0293022 [Dictyostelium discoideum AX4]|uniref:Uncharacterized protein n=1 Tax=Dictyostelium discoideum TaxID=44689 RepID=Q54CE9_DICDI|nr:hypothetical protein DDB_G0293022 [Dictyostelium discoideum AX4]EAL60863.1 hypothetical protein DDB_G0293022 [Dictyostelium discoideum AX4]|eukprot:XP_629270.1 hypothetical protein DDB_G0293022 [Dictyostelium discoideum AX4]
MTIEEGNTPPILDMILKGYAPKEERSKKDKEAATARLTTKEKKSDHNKQ